MCSIRSFLLLVLVAAAPLVTACSETSSTTTTLVGPTGVRCAVQLTSSPTSFAPEGGHGTIAVETNRECTWSIAIQGSWIALAGPADGQGTETVPYTVAANPAPSRRSAMIRVGDQQLRRVTQQPAPCRFGLDRTSQAIGPEAGDFSFHITTLAGCAWSATAGAGWIAVLDQGERNGSGAMRVRVAPNDGGSPGARRRLR